MTELVMVNSRDEVADAMRFYGAADGIIARAQETYDDIVIRYGNDLCIISDNWNILITSILLKGVGHAYDVMCYKEFMRRHG